MDKQVEALVVDRLQLDFGIHLWIIINLKLSLLVLKLVDLKIVNCMLHLN